MKTLTAKEVRDLLTVELPEFSSERWQFDHEQVIDFHKFHRLQYPIKLKTRTGNKYRYGTHYAPSSRNGSHHVIVMNADLSAEAANEWFLHELRHAIQCEMWARASGKPTGLFYDKFGPYHSAKGAWGASYRENEFEIDCRRFQKENKDDWTLITPREV